MQVTIIGLGLIGGSLALEMKARGFAAHIVGVDNNEEHCSMAMKLEFVDEILKLPEAIEHSDLVVLAIPVDAIYGLLPEVLDSISTQAVVTDMGSTKERIARVVNNHPQRGRYVASHPMSGTENTGPTAAMLNLFDGKAAIICDDSDSDTDALLMIRKMYELLNMDIIHMGASEHDMHAAYVSHISHISSFVLAKTVLEKEKKTEAIFDLASGGFESTVRLAKSSPQMWTPIFEQNAENVLEVIDTYIKNLEVFKQCIVNKESSQLYELMQDANQIRKILNKK